MKNTTAKLRLDTQVQIERDHARMLSKKNSTDKKETLLHLSSPATT